MSTVTAALLDRLSKKLNGASDYKIASELHVTRATVSKWRVGKGTMSDETAVRVAELLEENPAYVLALVQSERTQSPSAEKVWKKIAATFAGKAAAIVLAAALIGHGSNAHAAPALQASNCSGLYIMLYQGCGAPSARYAAA
jgi:predicted transcriptional regulator